MKERHGSEWEKRVRESVTIKTFKVTTRVYYFLGVQLKRKGKGT